MTSTTYQLVFEAVDEFGGAQLRAQEDLAFLPGCHFTEQFWCDFNLYEPSVLAGSGVNATDLPRTSPHEVHGYLTKKLKPTFPQAALFFNAVVSNLDTWEAQFGRNLPVEIYRELISTSAQHVQNGDHWEATYALYYLVEELGSLLEKRFDNGEDITRELTHAVAVPACRKIYSRFIEDIKDCNLTEEGKAMADAITLEMRRQLGALEAIGRSACVSAARQ